MSVSDIPDNELLARAVKGATNPYAYPSMRWAVISRLFGLGSTYSAELCRRYGLDPDEKMPRGKLLRVE